MLDTQGRLLPFRQISEYEVINFYAQTVTGVNGQFVAFVTGQQNPADADGYTTVGLASSYQGVYAPRWENKRKVRPTTAGDTKYNTLGVTLHTTAEEDTNGQRLVLLPRARREELGYVVFGESTPIVVRGVVTLRASAYVGTPIPGHVGLVTGNGQVVVFDPASLPATGGLRDQIVGKFLSTSGDAFGGYAQFKLEL